MTTTTKLPRVRAAVARMEAYVPGEQPRPGERVIKLNTNENPYPPSPRVVDIIRAFNPDQLRRYPSPMSDPFRDAVARANGVSRAHVIAGNGSDEILAMVMRTFLDAGDGLAYPDPTYSLYKPLADIHGIIVHTVPWAPGWRLPADALASSGARAVFFANPNAPSGTVVARADIAAFAESFSGLVLVDEAYVDFADDPATTTALPLIESHPNVIISRTLSKAYSLAGLRFGYALAHPDLIAQIMKVKDSYNCDALAIAAAAAAVDDVDHARQTWAAVRAERERLSAELVRRGWHVIPSQTNFLLTRPPAGDAAVIYQRLKSQGILVRHFAIPGLDDKLRISVGTPADTDALLAAL